MKIAMYDMDTYYLKRVCEIVSEKSGKDFEIFALECDEIERAIKDENLDACVLPESMEDLKEEALIPIIINSDDEEYVNQFEDETLYKYNDFERFFKDLNSAVEVTIKKLAEKKEEEKRRLEEEQRRLEEEKRLEEQRRLEEEQRRLEEEKRLEEQRRLEEEQRRLEEEKRRLEEERRTIIAFISLGDGYGNSTVAAGTVKYLAAKGDKVLYSNIHPFGTNGVFNVQNELTNINTVIGEIKQGKTLDSLNGEIGSSAENISVLCNTQNLYNVVNITDEDMSALFNQIRNGSEYKDLVIDTGILFNNCAKTVIEEADKLCVVLDGSDESNRRFNILMDYIRSINAEAVNKVRIIFNKYKSMPEIQTELEDAVVGGISYIEGANIFEVVDKIKNMNFLEYILK